MAGDTFPQLCHVTNRKVDDKRGVSSIISNYRQIAKYQFHFALRRIAGGLPPHFIKIYGTLW
jgi:hypothetical protein